MVQPLLIFGDWGILVLRIVLGIILVAHGWSKIRNLKDTGGAFVVTSLVEFVGGLFIVFGFLTQTAAVLVAIQFLVILLIKTKRGQKLVPSFEFELLIFAAALALVALGGGLYALDEYLGIWVY
jgi:putative oxidoreductase